MDNLTSTKLNTENDIQTFNNPKFGEIRTEDIDGKIYFCGKDVALALGYSNHNKALNDHCKKDGVTFCDLIDNLGRSQKAKFISEGNLYRLISSSNLPEAEEFEKWVFDEVLPSIRKTGGYAVRSQYVPTEYEIEQQKLKKAVLLKEIADQYDGKSKQVLHAYATKALEGQFLLPLPEQKKTYPASEIGKMLGVSPNKIGKISNQYNLKVDKYGEWFRDKSQYSNKEVSTFRYYDEAVPEMKKILKEEAVR